MPKRYTSRELVKLAEEFGWRLVGVRGGHHNFKHPASRFIVTIVHPQKDVPVGRAADSERCRSAFRGDGDRDSELMPITIPN
jgi:predicted RNA binding protein YcfA (HicA-like mRNA interferase family)